MCTIIFYYFTYFSSFIFNLFDLTSKNQKFDKNLQDIVKKPQCNVEKKKKVWKFADLNFSTFVLFLEDMKCT